MSLNFIDLTLISRFDSCRIQRNFNADATVLPAKPKEKEPALSVCKLFPLCQSGCSALGFSFSRSESDSAVPAPQTVHRPQAQSRETPSFPSRFSRSDANGLCNHRNDVCNTIIPQQKTEPSSSAQPREQLPEMQCRKSDRNGVADVDQTGSNVFVIRVPHPPGSPPASRPSCRRYGCTCLLQQAHGLVAMADAFTRSRSVGEPPRVDMAPEWWHGSRCRWRAWISFAISCVVPTPSATMMMK